MKRPVVVTGVGVISSIGSGRDAFWSKCLEGATNVAPIPAHWKDYTRFSSPVWAPLELPDFDRFAISRAERMQMDNVQLLSLAAAELAISDAGMQSKLRDDRKNTFQIADVPQERAGVYMGTGNGGLVSYTEGSACHLLSPIGAYLKKNPPADDAAPQLRFRSRFNPFSVAMTMPNAVSAALSIKYGFTGPSVTVSSACASGTSAVGAGYRAVASGDVDVALAGGAEYLADPYGGIFRGFDVAGTLVRPGLDPERANRPFDSRRSGFLFGGGGCAVLVLEEAEAAAARGARPLARIGGYAQRCDAYTIMGMSPDGAQVKQMYRDLFDMANCTPGDIDYINAHGTATKLNDQTEAAIIDDVFGKKPLVNSTKSLIGHTIGAAGAIEAAVTAMSIHAGAVHPSINLDEPIGDLNFVRGSAKEAAVNRAVTQSFGFGGHIAGLVLTQPSLP